MLAYRNIKGNKGSLTKAYITSFERKKRMTLAQRSFVERTFKAPDGINFEMFETTAELLKEGKYPWGTSRRIYIDKPGTEKKRPITIPPFMDKVVQTAIKMILESVYEPYFEYQNQSFGFRTHKGCHDAIYNLSRPYTASMNMSIEGDIKAAYDLVKKTKLLYILGLRIQDKKFLKLIKERLDYEVYDTEKGAYLNEKEGIPQGGIDSPYL
jgi:retron-type reverse transcriptase